MSISLDTLLEGKVKILQPSHGYRAGLDAVFLAAACDIRGGQSLLDVGCGVGSVFLCINQRIPNLEIYGIEASDVYFELAQKNLQENACSANLFLHSIPEKGDPLSGKKYDHVVTNPPYHEREHHAPSPSPLRARALGETTVPLDAWLDYCLRKTSDQGYITLIYPTKRIDDVLSYLHLRAGDIHIYPLWSDEVSCKRVIISGRKNAKGGTVLHRGMLIHNDDGTYTSAAENILRKGQTIALRSRDYA